MKRLIAVMMSVCMVAGMLVVMTGCPDSKPKTTDTKKVEEKKTTDTKVEEKKTTEETKK